MQHLFKSKAHDLQGLFEDVDKLSTFMNRLEGQAFLDPGRYDSLRYLGDGFEFFIELLLSLHPADNRIGIYQYSPVQVNDNGVDGVGINVRGEKSVAQVKFRSNAASLLTATKDHLGNFITDAMMAHGVVIDTENSKNYRHFIFTTAEGLHYYTDSEVFKGRVKCFGYNQIRGLVDNNYPFWTAANEIVRELNEQFKGTNTK